MNNRKSSGKKRQTIAWLFSRFVAFSLPRKTFTYGFMILSKFTSLPIISKKRAETFSFVSPLSSDETREKFVQLKISFTLHQQFFPL